MKARPNTSQHVRYSEAGELICRHCGFHERVDGPLPVREFCRRLNSFVAGHAGCPKPEEERKDDGNNHN